MNIFPDVVRVRGHTIWAEQLRPGSTVVDAGAHRGEFSRVLQERFGCACWPVEANPVLATGLRDHGFINTIPAALGAADGKARFIFRDNPESGSLAPRKISDNADTAEVDVISLPTLMRRVGLTQIDLLKLDIEGAEFDVIERTPDEMLRSVGQITVEFHDFLPDFCGRGLYERARQRLVDLGFLSCPMAFRTNGDTLFVNKRAQFGFFTRAYLKYGARWVFKFGDAQ